MIAVKQVEVEKGQEDYLPIKPKTITRTYAAKQKMIIFKIILELKISDMQASKQVRKDLIEVKYVEIGKNLKIIKKQLNNLIYKISLEEKNHEKIYSKFEDLISKSLDIRDEEDENYYEDLHITSICPITKGRRITDVNFELFKISYSTTAVDDIYLGVVIVDLKEDKIIGIFNNYYKPELIHEIMFLNGKILEKRETIANARWEVNLWEFSSSSQIKVVMTNSRLLCSNLVRENVYLDMYNVNIFSNLTKTYVMVMFRTKHEKEEKNIKFYSFYSLNFPSFSLEWIFTFEEKENVGIRHDLTRNISEGIPYHIEQKIIGLFSEKMERRDFEENFNCFFHVVREGINKPIIEYYYVSQIYSDHKWFIKVTTDKITSNNYFLKDIDSYCDYFTSENYISYICKKDFLIYDDKYEVCIIDLEGVEKYRNILFLKNYLGFYYDSRKETIFIFIQND